MTKVAIKKDQNKKEKCSHKKSYVTETGKDE